MEFIPIKSSSLANLYIVKNDNVSILLEAGLQGTALKKAVNLGSIDACLVTHSHADHAKGIKDIARLGIDCYMSNETAVKADLRHHRINVIKPLEQFFIDDIAVLPFPTEHCAGSFGFLISDGEDKLVFITDTHYCRYKFKGLTMIAIECNYSDETISPDIIPAVRDRIYTAHFSLERVIKFMRSNDLSKVREIYLLHLSDDNSDEDFFKNTIQRLTGVPVYVAPK